MLASGPKVTFGDLIMPALQEKQGLEEAPDSFKVPAREGFHASPTHGFEGLPFESARIPTHIVSLLSQGTPTEGSAFAPSSDFSLVLVKFSLHSLLRQTGANNQPIATWWRQCFRLF